MASQPMYKYPSMNSVHSMVGMGHLPPGHGYVPTRVKPDKPYGPSFVTVMNRMWRGPGRKYINYAIVCLCIAILFFVGGAVYFGHRNVGRMRVLNTEVLGALLIVIGILFTAGFFQLIYKANVESDRWRSYVRFKPEGLYTAAAYNQAYLPGDTEELLSGTYGPMAIKEIPRTARPVKSRGRSGMLRSGAQTPRSGLQTPASRRGSDFTDADAKGYSSRAPYSDPYTAQDAHKPQDIGPTRAQGAGYKSSDMGPIRAQGAYYDERADFRRQPSMYQSDKEREAFGGQSFNNSGDYFPQDNYGRAAPPYASVTGEMTEIIRPSLMSTPQPSYSQQQKLQQQQEVPEQPSVVLPPVRRNPVLPPVHRQPVTSSKKSQNDAFIG